jgi:hypothetical protein
MYNGYAEEEDGAQKRRKMQNTIKERTDRWGDGKDGQGALRKWGKNERGEREVSEKVNKK